MQAHKNMTMVTNFRLYNPQKMIYLPGQPVGIQLQNTKWKAVFTGHLL